MISLPLPLPLPSPPSSEDQAPGSATAVASNLLQAIVTQFADRRLFIFLFGHTYDEAEGGAKRGVAERVFGALGACLPALPAMGEGEGEGGEEAEEGISIASPVTYFLQVIHTVKTLNNGHTGTSHFVLYREVLLSLY